MEPLAGGVRWVDAAGTVIAAASSDGALWRLNVHGTAVGSIHQRPAGGPVAVLALTEGRLRCSAESGIVVDGDGRVLVAIRRDGPTGLHLVDTEGCVIALVSGPHTRRDVLVTAAGASRLALVLAVLLAVELAPSTAAARRAS